MKNKVFEIYIIIKKYMYVNIVTVTKVEKQTSN